MYRLPMKTQRKEKSQVIQTLQYKYPRLFKRKFSLSLCWNDSSLAYAKRNVVWNLTEVIN